MISCSNSAKYFRAVPSLASLFRCRMKLRISSRACGSSADLVRHNRLSAPGAPRSWPLQRSRVSLVRLTVAECALEFLSQDGRRQHVVVAGGNIAAGFLKTSSQRFALRIRDAGNLLHNGNENARAGFACLCHGRNIADATFSTNAAINGEVSVWRNRSTPGLRARRRAHRPRLRPAGARSAD